MSSRAGWWRAVGWLALGWVGLALGGQAQAADEDKVPADTAVLEVQLPPGAKVLVDGEPSERTRFTYRPLEKGQTHIDEVRVRFADGKETTQSVLLRGGWRVRLPLRGKEAPNRPETVVQTGHTMAISSVAFSPDGRYVLTGSSDKTAVLWEAGTGRKFRAFKHTDGVTAVAFSPDGKHVLTGSEDQTAALWEAGTGRKLRDFQGHTGSVHAVAFNPDGKHVLTGSDDQMAALWEADSGRKLRDFQGHTEGVLAVAFSPDGRYVLTNSGDKTAALWEAGTGRKLRDFKGHTHWVHAVAFSPDGKHVLTGSMDGTTRLWDIATGDELAQLLSLDAGQDWLVVSPEGLFDGSEGGRNKVAFRLGGGLNVVPVDDFFTKFYRPGLLALLFRGERPLPEVEIAGSRPPVVRIRRPASGGTVTEAEVELEVEALDQGSGVRGPWVSTNGVPVLTNVEPRRDGKTVTLRLTVPLISGDNRIEAWAEGNDRVQQKSARASLTLRYERPLARPTLHLVAVGVSKYTEDRLSLKFARQDAEALCRLFERRKKALYQEVEKTLLVDEQAGGQAIRAAVRKATEKARAEDVLLLFLAGHGRMVGERYYFIPHDFKSRPGRSIEDDVREQGVPADALTSVLTEGACQKPLLILDTCASGGAVSLFRPSSRNGFEFRGAVERLNKASGTCVLAASAATEKAQESDALGHGVLSYALLAGLKAIPDDRGLLKDKAAAGSGPRQVVTVLQWFAFAEEHVPALTRFYCQQEQNARSVTSGNFPVLPLENP